YLRLWETWGAHCVLFNGSQHVLPGASFRIQQRLESLWPLVQFFCDFPIEHKGIPLALFRVVASLNELLKCDCQVVVRIHIVLLLFSCYAFFPASAFQPFFRWLTSTP